MTNASCAGPYGGKYRHALAAGIQALSHLLEPGYLGEEIELRHPFLYRPLVEFALGLPPELCVCPQARKWVLREAMRGLVPETVRCRIGKGGVESLLAWSFTAHREAAGAADSCTHAGSARDRQRLEAAAGGSACSNSSTRRGLSAHPGPVHADARSLASTAVRRMATAGSRKQHSTL